MNTLILNTGLALVTASTIHAQESSLLSADYLKQATPLIHWPNGLEPINADVFVHNEGWINASPNIVWGNLIDVLQWPGWYSNSADVHVEGASPGSLWASAFTGKRSASRFLARWMSLSRTGRSAGVSIVRSSRFTTPGSSSRNEAGRTSSPRNHKRVLMRSGSGLISQTRCTTAMTGGFLR